MVAQNRPVARAGHYVELDVAGMVVEDPGIADTVVVYTSKEETCVVSVSGVLKGPCCVAAH